MAIEIKEMVIKTSVDSTENTGGDEKFYEELKKIKKDILKESMENVIEYLERLKER